MWLPVKIILANLAISCLVCQNVQSQETQPLSLSTTELQTLLNFLYAPNDELFALQRAALRQQLHNLLEQQEQQLLQQEEPSDDYYYADTDKRSITSLARGKGVLRNGKRNLAALARTGQILHFNPNGLVDEMKRSVASLAKTGQLPSKEPDAEDGQLDEDYSWQGHDNKRSLGSLARSGNLLPSSGGKRNLASLRKNDMMPYALKRSLAALARENMLPGIKRDFIVEQRRNIGTMARDYALPNQKTRVVDSKRNLGALKNSPVHGSTRDKRQIPVDDNLEMSEPVYQTSPVDYDELLAALESNVYPPPSATHNEQKRFLGSVARSGGFRPLAYYQDNRDSYPSAEKRHISSLARLGFYRPSYSGGFYRASPQKRHIGALARTTLSPDHPTDSNYLSPAASVDVARPSTRVVGPPLVYKTGGSRPDSPRSSGDTSSVPTVYHNSPPLLLLLHPHHVQPKITALEDVNDGYDDDRYPEERDDDNEEFSVKLRSGQDEQEDSDYLYDEWDLQNHL